LAAAKKKSVHSALAAAWGARMSGSGGYAVAIVGGAGVAIATLLLVDYENRRQRRFVAGRESKHRGIDKKAVKEAVAQQSEVLEQLLPKTFFAEPAPEETSRKSAGGPGWWAQLGLRVSNSGVVQGIGMVLAVPFPE